MFKKLMLAASFAALISTASFAGVKDSESNTKSLNTYLNSHIAYPRAAKDQMVEGTVYVAVTVENGKFVIVNSAATNDLLKAHVESKILNLNPADFDIEAAKTYNFRFKFDLKS